MHTHTHKHKHPHQHLWRSESDSAASDQLFPSSFSTAYTTPSKKVSEAQQEEAQQDERREDRQHRSTQTVLMDTHTHRRRNEACRFTVGWVVDITVM